MTLTIAYREGAMRHVFALGIALILVGFSDLSRAQEENRSGGRFVGVGARFLPHALMPIGPSDVDPALSTAITGQYWVSDLLAIEVGGWLSGFSDAWSPRSLTSLSGGLLLKLSDNAHDDLYLVGRAITVQSVYRHYCCVYREGEPPAAAQQEIIPPPWPSLESRTSTLAFEIAVGIERSWSTHVTTNLEFGFVYAQVMTTHLPPPGVPVPTEESVSLPKPETVAATSFGITMHISVNFYLPRK